MELSEEKQLKLITKEFTEGVQLFREKECQQAFDIFKQIDDEYKDSQYYSVLEIQSRAKLYKMLCDSRLHPVEVELNDDEDYLFDGIFYLNNGNLDIALERFNTLEEKKYDDPYLDYLLSLVYLKKHDTNMCLQYLQKAIDADEFYKIIAYNEPDFEPMFENEKFSAVVELESSREG